MRVPSSERLLGSIYNFMNAHIPVYFSFVYLKAYQLLMGYSVRKSDSFLNA